MEGKYCTTSQVIGNGCNQSSDYGISAEYGIVEPMEDQDELGGSDDIWRYIRDIVVQGDWEDKNDDFTFMSTE